MIAFLQQFGEWVKVLLNIITYAIIPMFTLFVVYGLMKWVSKTKEGIKEVSKNPLLLILWIGLSVLGIVLFVKYISPIFNN